MIDMDTWKAKQRFSNYEIADEDFEAVLKFMWDKNAIDYLHFETIAFATAHLIARLKEEL